MSLLMANLNPSLVVSIINRDDYNPSNPPSFECFIKKAQDSYVKWIAKQPFQNKRFGPTQQHMWNATFRRNRANNNNSRGEQYHTTSQGGYHMDIDAAKMGGPLTEAEKEEHHKNNLCFYCHKKGHHSNVCFTKKKNQQEEQLRTASWSGVT